MTFSLNSVRVYQTLPNLALDVLPKVLDKILRPSEHILLWLQAACSIESCAQRLWTFSTPSFLPHGSIEDENIDAKRQPIWVTHEQENLNNARILFCFEDIPENHFLHQFQQVIIILSQSTIEHNSSVLLDRLKKIKTVQDMQYWIQTTPKGGWQSETSLKLI